MAQIVPAARSRVLPLSRDRSTPALGLFPRFHDALSEPPADLDEERAGAHRHVADLEVEELGRRPQLPGLARLALRRADIDEGLERLGDDLLGQRLRRVVRAGLRRSDPPVTMKLPAR